MEIMLSFLKPNKSGKIVRIEGGYGLQRKLRTMGIREGKSVKIIARQPIKGPVVIEINGRQTTIGRGMANKIIVEI
jgi:ferrous iron transport protein A